MEFIEGPSLRQIIDHIFKGNTWFNLSIESRLILLDYLLQVIHMLEELHKKGYVHRDLTPNNFLLRKNKRLVFIDLELSFSIKNQKPLPPFQLGTYGFMSPEQLTIATPK